eukprot:578250_1
MGGCCCLDISGSALTCHPNELIMIKGKETKSFGRCVVLQVFENRLAYDGCNCFNFCCLCQCCRGIIAFTQIHTVAHKGNDIAIVMKDGWKVDIVGLSREEREVIINMFSENTSFLP